MKSGNLGISGKLKDVRVSLMKVWCLRLNARG